MLVTPAAPPVVPSPLPTPEAWFSTADRSPDIGHTVTVDTPSGPVAARLLLSDEASGGAAWHTARGEHLDHDEVSRWRP